MGRQKMWRRRSLVEEVRDDRAEKAAARAFAAMLLGSVISGLVFAGILTNFQGGFYIPLLMPYLLGRATGGLTVGIAQRWKEPSLRAATACALIGSVVTLIGYHLMAYQAVIDLLEKDALPDLVTWLQEVTGAQGVMAYVTLATDPTLGFSGNISPFGVAGEVLTSPALFLGAFVLEIAAGSLGARHGVQRSLTSQRSRPIPRLLAEVPAQLLEPIVAALDAGNVVRAGKLIAESDPDPDIRIDIAFPEDETHPHVLRVLDQRNGSLRAQVTLSIDQALMMMDQMRLAEARRLYGADDSTSA